MEIDFQTLTAITRCPPPSDGHWTIVLGEDHAGAEGNSAPWPHTGPQGCSSMQAVRVVAPHSLPVAVSAQAVLRWIGDEMDARLLRILESRPASLASPFPCIPLFAECNPPLAGHGSPE